MKIRMIKRLVIGSALALVFVGGAFINASAQSRYGAHPCLGNCAVVQPPAQASCQGAYNYGPTTPTPFGTGGAAGG
ncbi:MAG: hypothetical protein P4L43_01640 [Syntrophobacteraceae bacterium]|nr:hypothetical protein [Syntrophobacteraceae bacterium]